MGTRAFWKASGCLLVWRAALIVLSSRAMNRAMLSVSTAIWFCLVAFWPKQANVPSTPFDRPPAAGEGLFKSSLTSANSGLLDVHFLETANGKKHWSIRSRFAELHRRENVAYLRDVDAEFFAARTGNIIRTRSDQGRSLVDQQVVELEGKVSIESKKGYQFTMSKLRYTGEGHEFQTDESVQIRGPSITNPILLLRGTGLHADIDREHFFLRRNVSAQKKLKGADWLRVQAKGGEFFTDEQRAVFIGGVRSSLPKIQIESEILEIALEPDSESLLARGGVVVRSRDRVGYADNAFLQANNSKIVLEGKAKVDAKDNQVKGRRITIYTDDDRIEVEQAQGRAKSTARN